MSDSKKTRKVVVADDDELLLRLLEYKLLQLGLDVITCGDGESALRATREECPDLVVLDGMMPGMDGFEVLRELKEDESTRAIPVVMLTARSLEKDVVTGLTLGADEYLVKPFNPEEFIVRIQRLLRPG